MDFKDMSYVLAIAKYGNITKAAESIYLTQPSLSRFLQNVERDIGQPLFKRVGNKYIPTYIGERYIEYATQILNEKSELDHEINDIVKRNVGLLKIGIPSMRATYLLPCTLPIFKSLYPNMKLDLRETNSAQLRQLILSGEIDLAFFNLVEKNPNIDYEIISHEELVLIMSRRNDLVRFGESRPDCKYPHMDISRLEDAPIIMQQENQMTRHATERVFRKAHFEPNIIVTTGNIPAAAQLAAKNYGLYFITETHLKHMDLEDEIACFSIGEPYTTIDFVAAYRRNSYLPYHAQEFIKIVRDFT